MNSRPSVRRRLLASLMSVILVVWLVVVLLVFRAAQLEVKEVFDADLARSAGVLMSLLLHEVDEEKEASQKASEVVAEIGEKRLREFPRLAKILTEIQTESEHEKLELVGLADESGRPFETELAFIARYADGSVMVQDLEAPEIPETMEGFQDIQLDDRAWRVYRTTDSSTGFAVQVGEKKAVRDQLSRYIASNSLIPLLIMLPVLAVLIWIVVGKALAPINRVAGDVSERTGDALDPIDDAETPQEVFGLVSALNRLFQRLRSAIERERQFSADAAHELRTPLAALKTHLQVAQASSADAGIRQSLDQALKGVDRATHSVEQLLALARADAQQPQLLALPRVNLLEIANSVVTELSQQAHEAKIDLGIDASEAAWTKGICASLGMMARNLVDNAVRYTPAGGTVSVKTGVTDNRPWLQVSDNGRGIPEKERSLVFNRFHRVTSLQTSDTSGSGLGLAIVDRIAKLHGAFIEMSEGLGGKGITFKVWFPAHES